MLGFYSRTLIALTVALALSLMAWPWYGPLGAALAFIVLLLLILAFHVRQLGKLHAWLKNPTMEQVPESFGTWEAVYHRLYQMVRTQFRSQQKLSSALDRFISAGEAMPDGVVVLNEKDRIEWCNPVSMRHFGLDRRQDIGQQISYLVRNPDFVEYLHALDYAHPLNFRPSRSQELLLSVQLVPFDSTRKLLISRDITQLEKVQTVLRDFVANVSHELRTPLTVIGGFLETLLDLEHPDPAATARYMRLMLDQAKRMQRIVEDLLTLSRLENGQNQLRDEPVNIPQMLQSIYADAQTISADRHHITLDLATEFHVLGNRDELYSAFSNLVSNAIRYTPEGGDIRLVWKTENRRAVFSVTDTGIGIDPQHIPRLTERFYRVDKGRSRDTGGTGLGLAIVKHILLRHHATLEIQSQPGTGSCFQACFPPDRLAVQSTSPAMVTRM